VQLVNRLNIVTLNLVKMVGNVVLSSSFESWLGTFRTNLYRLYLFSSGVLLPKSCLGFWGVVVAIACGHYWTRLACLCLVGTFFRLAAELVVLRADRIVQLDGRICGFLP
jgi:hypothetical protein